MHKQNFCCLEKVNDSMEKGNIYFPSENVASESDENSVKKTSFTKLE